MFKAYTVSKGKYIGSSSHTFVWPQFRKFIIEKIPDYCINECLVFNEDGQLLLRSKWNEDAISLQELINLLKGISLLEMNDLQNIVNASFYNIINCNDIKNHGSLKYLSWNIQNGQSKQGPKSTLHSLKNTNLYVLSIPKETSENLKFGNANNGYNHINYDTCKHSFISTNDSACKKSIYKLDYEILDLNYKSERPLYYDVNKTLECPYYNKQAYYNERLFIYEVVLSEFIKSIIKILLIATLSYFIYEIIKIQRKSYDDDGMPINARTLLPEVLHRVVRGTRHTLGINTLKSDANYNKNLHRSTVILHNELANDSSVNPDVNFQRPSVLKPDIKLRRMSRRTSNMYPDADGNIMLNTLGIEETEKRPSILRFERSRGHDDLQSSFAQVNARFNNQSGKNNSLSGGGPLLTTEDGKYSNSNHVLKRSSLMSKKEK